MLRLPGHWPGWSRAAGAAALVCLGLVCTAGPGICQSDAQADPIRLGGPTLMVTSDPTGAIVHLRGAYEWVGQTPWDLDRGIQGVYLVEARLPGYEVWKGEVVVGPGGISSLHIRLSPKSAWKAGVRSLLVPGWGQFYNGSGLRGGLILGASAVALGGLLWTHELYRDEVDDFDAAKAAYQGATRQEDLPALKARLDKASRDADRAYDRRMVLLGAAAGLYALSFLDAVLFGPSGSARIDGRAANLPPEDEAGPYRAAGGETGDGPGLAGGINPDASLRLGFAYTW